MPTNGFSRKTVIHPIVAGLVTLSWMCVADDCRAQPPRKFVPPAPLGSQFVPVGPSASPFGSPPMAIGPAPVPLAYGPPVLAPPGYPAIVYPATPYPVAPYQVRRPTRFGPATPPILAPQPLESQIVVAPVAQPEPFAAPVPIGNLRLTISESFLNRLVARDEQKPGEVNDFILGAQVTGRQMTFTKLRFDLLPNSENIRGALVLNGTVQSQTTGVTSQAMIDTAGRQQFLAVKELFFDGMKFSTRHAVVQVRAHNQTVGATTALSGTMLGGIASRIAYRAAERRQQEGEAVARDRVAERVYPEFDNSIDNKLASANEQLDGTVRRMLGTLNLMPTQQQAWSSDTYLSYAMQIPSESTATSSADPLDSQIVKDDGASLLIHESLLNTLVGRAGLKGLKTTDKQIKALFAPYEVKTADDPLDRAKPAVLPGMNDVVTDVEFDENDPLTIRIERDRTLVTLRASFKPAGQQVVPPLAVTIEYKTELAGDKILVSPGKVQVDLLKKDDDKAPSGIALKLISQAIEASLSKLAFDRSLPPTFWSFGGVVPSVRGIRSQDGWAAITIN